MEVGNEEQRGQRGRGRQHVWRRWLPHSGWVSMLSPGRSGWRHTGLAHGEPADTLLAFDWIPE